VPKPQIRQFGSNLDVLAPVIVFLSFQRCFVQGAMAGSIK